MGNFRDRFQGLTEEQLRIKNKVWEREQVLREETERAIFESEQNKNKNVVFFGKDDDNYDFGDWAGPFEGNGGHGVVSDGPLAGATVTFLSYGNIEQVVLSDENGNFQVPWTFKTGVITISGGKDIVTGEDYKGEFKIDGAFFGKYKAVTPLTHVANHIWMNTPTELPEQAMDLVLNSLPGLLGISLPEIDKDSLFNDDHIKLTMEGVNGAKEIQAINTMLDIHAEIVGNAVATTNDEITSAKVTAYENLANQLLGNINGNGNNLTVGENTELLDCHKECCKTLIDKANAIIIKSVNKELEESTREMQSVNMAVKTEWSHKAFEMTNDEEITSKDLWKSIENKTQKDLINSVNIPVS